MKVISVSTDRKIFEEDSSVRMRMKDYAALFEEFHIIVFSRKASKFSRISIAPNAWVYPTHSWHRFFYIRDAEVLANGIVQKYSLGKNDIITPQDPFECGLVALRIKKNFGLKLAVQVHTDFLNQHFSSFSILNMVRVMIASRIIPNADKIRVVSGRIRDSIVTRYGFSREKITVLPIASDVRSIAVAPRDRDALSVSGAGPVILMASRLAPEKRIETGMRAFARVAQENGDARLAVVGSGPMEKKLKRLADKLGIADKVVFEGWRNDPERFYNAADIFLNTSAYEGFGMSLIEAAAAGLAIVTTDVGLVGDRLINGESCITCPVDDDEAFSRALSKVITENELRKKLGENARSQALGSIQTPDEYKKNYRNSFE